MKFNYHIYNKRDINASNAGAFPFSNWEAKEQHAYECFPEAVRLHYLESAIRATCTLEPNGNGVIVVLVGEMPEQEASLSLSELVVRQNRAMSRLRLVIDSI